MRLMHTLVGIVTCGCLAATPAFAGQRGHQGPPMTPAAHTDPAHPTTPSHPAAAARPANNAVHPAPVPVPQKIAANPALVTRLQPLLPAGTTLAAAATGFRNQGQFIAALHVSKNLNIPLASLKNEMTGADHDSLGQAIQDLQPTANAKTAVKTAEQEAAADLKATKPAKVNTDKDDR